MITSQGKRYNTGVVASSVSAGRTYVQHGNHRAAPFTVLAITDGYMIDEGDSVIKRHRKAIVQDRQGFYFVQKIYATFTYEVVEE